VQWKQKLRFHLGGAPFFYIYHDLPEVNLYRIFNALGVALFFSCTLIASWMYLAKITPARISSVLQACWTRVKEMLRQKNPVTEDPRLVKLRIPQAATTVPPDMLEIQPETHPKVRPSLSRKEIPESPMKPPPPAKDPPITRREAALVAQRVHN